MADCGPCAAERQIVGWVERSEPHQLALSVPVEFPPARDYNGASPLWGPAMPVRLDQFVEGLAATGLMSAEQVAAFIDGQPSDKRPNDAESLARALFAAGKLTRFQAQAVYQGKGKALVLGEYLLLDKLGEGGMGQVYKALHRRMDRTVALKTLSPKTLNSPDALRRFHHEVRAAARLSHPNIVTAHDASEHAGVHYLVMEYVDGESLAELVHRHGPLPVAQAVECMLQAARGLQYAHDQGVVHRDIKPGNLLVDRQGTVKILDMGLARFEEQVGPYDPTASDRLTQSGHAMGTWDYMAPEQAEDAHRADHRADIYSLGCTLYRLLTGRPPYHRESTVQTLMAHREAPIPSLRAARDDVPADLDKVFRRMVAKDPKDRYQSMTQVIEALRACQAGLLSGSEAEVESSSSGQFRSFVGKLQVGQLPASSVERTFASHEPPEVTALAGRVAAAARRHRWALAIGGAVVAAVVLFFACRAGFWPT